MQPHSNTSPEEWRPAVGWEDWYEVSDLGRVRRTRAAMGATVGHILAPVRVGNGYLGLRLSRNNHAVTCTIHRLVLATFVRPSRDGEETNHVNGVKTDNRTVNLEWVTAYGNQAHARRTGLMPVGERRPEAKLTAVDVLAIRAARGSASQSQLGRRYGVSKGTIEDIQLRRTWRHI